MYRPSPKNLVIISMLLIILLTLYHLHITTLAYTHTQDDDPTSLPRCSNAIIFTGARQGSTWFLDSVEQCAFSLPNASARSGAPRFAANSFKRTELWKHFGEPALDGTNLSAEDAVQYIVRNNSVKIFPSVFQRRRNDISTILDRRFEYNLTVLLLRRDVQASWESWWRANTSKVWNGAVKQVNAEYNPEQQKKFFESRARYDKAVEDFLNEQRVLYDLFDYDESKNEPYLIARNNGCYIANCNFPEQIDVSTNAVSRDVDDDGEE